MKIIGLTGGIGSGKSTIASFFERLGIPVYYTDVEAKNLMQNDPKVREDLTALLGAEAYQGDALNRSFIADLIFNDSALLAKMNAIVHPAVARHFDQWATQQQSPYVIKETAILFENNGQEYCDYTILVCAPLTIRIERVVQRDQIAPEKVLDRIQHQWDDARKMPLADFIVENVSLEDAEKKVLEIHQKLVK